MKRIAALLLAACLLLPAAGLGEETYKKLPACFEVKYSTEEKLINNEKSFVSKDVIQTVLPEVDEEINGIADRMEETYTGQLKPYKTPKRNSRLDVHIVHSVSGDSAVSFLILARDTYRRTQRQSPFETRTFDMEDGRPIALTDLFGEDSPAWNTLSDEVSTQLKAYFPKETPNPNAVGALCARDALKKTPFMLGPVCLTLLYEASALYPKHPTLMKVTIPYSQIREDMTDYGKKQTDNQNYKMVALTFDDGPTLTNSGLILNSLRHAGAKATYFLIGNLIAKNEDVVMREHDEMHSVQSHHYVHVDSRKTTVGRIQGNTTRFYNALTKAIGIGPIMLRAPGGWFKAFVKAKINLTLIEWDVDTKDWQKSSSTSRVLSKVQSMTKPGSIILMHDIKDKTTEAAPKVMEWLHENDYLMVSVEDLFRHYGTEMKLNKVYQRVDPPAEK